MKRKRSKKQFSKKQFPKLLAVLVSAGMMMTLSSGSSGRVYAENPQEADGGYIEMDESWDDGVPAAEEDVDLSDADVIHLEEAEQPEDVQTDAQTPENGLYGSYAEDSEDSDDDFYSPEADMDELTGAGEYTAWPFTATEAANDSSGQLLSRFPVVRNQGNYNTCWAFTAIGMMEMSMISQGRAGTSVDYSELALAYSSYHLPDDRFGGLEGDLNSLANGGDFLSGGGNMVIALPTLFTWAGAVGETDVSYSRAAAVSASGLSADLQRKDQAHIRELRLFNVKENPNAVKQWIRENGAVSFTMYKSSDFRTYYNRTKNSYYVNTGMVANHAVDVVGWDDAFPGSAFANNRSSSGAPRNGAWLVRNSYGSNNYGFYGYFWLSYADASIGDTVYGVVAESANNYMNNYQYDGAGYSVNIETKQAANIFRARTGEGETLKAVAVGLAGSDLSYTVEIYRNLKDLSDPTSGELCSSSTVNGSISQAGIYTVKLKKAVQLNLGEYYAVVVTVNGSGARVMAESSYNRGGDLRISASMKRQQSFVRSGKNSTWIDLKDGWSSYYNHPEGGNLRIKAFTDTVGDGTAIISDGWYGQESVDAVPMYRLYNVVTQEHFYTSSAHERSVLISVGWTDEKIGWYAPKNGDPVYRLYNKTLRDHHYTTSKQERDTLVHLGWISEGIGWYSDPDKGVPLYRQFHPGLTSGSHNYTVSKYEASVLISRGWKDEKIGWYGVKTNS